MNEFQQARINMVDGQIHPNGIIDPRILEVFSNTPRELFVPEDKQGVCYLDEDLEIKPGRYLMDPTVLAKMIQALDLKDTEVVLDVAMASGYSSAILSPLAQTIITQEKDKALLEKAEATLNTLERCNVVYCCDETQEGCVDYSPYDAILVNGALSAVPDELTSQLKPGGRLVCVVRENMTAPGKAILCKAQEGGTVSQKVLFDANIPFLAGHEPAHSFSF